MNFNYEPPVECPLHCNFLLSPILFLSLDFWVTKSWKAMIAFRMQIANPRINPKWEGCVKTGLGINSIQPLVEVHAQEYRPLEKLVSPSPDGIYFEALVEVHVLYYCTIMTYQHVVVFSSRPIPTFHGFIFLFFFLGKRESHFSSDYCPHLCAETKHLFPKKTFKHQAHCLKAKSQKVLKLDICPSSSVLHGMYYVMSLPFKVCFWAFRTALLFLSFFFGFYLNSLRPRLDFNTRK